MYEELIKRLRDAATMSEALAVLLPHSVGNATAKLYNEAADAIEELSMKLHGEEAAILGMKREIERMVANGTHRWIPVTERLPEQRINQNTLDFEYVLCTTTFGDVRPFKYGRRIGQGNAHFWNGEGYVDAYVTHWMPLPQPPKGER